MILTNLLTSQPDTSMSVPDAGIIALLGYAVVFVGLIVLMLVVMAIGKFFVASAKKKADAVKEETVSAPAAAVVSGPVAPGAAGELKLYDVEPKTAAMLMAIVAEKTGKPINELRFISVREVK